MTAHFSETNPNDGIGGGGCLCSGLTKGRDTKPPYVIFPASETEMPSPHAVLCAGCPALKAALAKAAPDEDDGPAV